MSIILTTFHFIRRSRTSRNNRKKVILSKLEVSEFGLGPYQVLEKDHDKTVLRMQQMQTNISMSMMHRCYDVRFQMKINRGEQFLFDFLCYFQL